MAGWCCRLDRRTGDPPVGLLADEKGSTWHARSWCRRPKGWLGVAMFLAFVLGAWPHRAFASIKLGSFGLLLPIYLSVAHRMFPVLRRQRGPRLHALAAAVVAGRGMGAGTGPSGAGAGPRLCLAVAGQMPLLLLTGLGGVAPVAARADARTAGGAVHSAPCGCRSPSPCTPRRVWCSPSMAASSSVAHRCTRCSASSAACWVAMVTRVTQGHWASRRRCARSPGSPSSPSRRGPRWRILADVLPDPGLWQALAAVGWLLAPSPWVMRIGHIYLDPRRDGRPG